MPDNAAASEPGQVAWVSNNLKLRLASGILFAALAFALTYAGPVPFAVLVLVCALVMSWEWGRLVRGSAFDLGFFVHAGAVFAAVIIGLTNLAPILLLPLFYTLKPLGRESLRIRLVAMAERAGARVLGVYEWGLAEKTKKANAALTGIGSTRRILVSDTMLAEYTEEEIEVVMAHELAHHVH